MPAFGILYWAKYRFADLSMISELYGTATRVDLNKFSICGTGFFQCLEHLNIEIKSDSRNVFWGLRE